MRSIEIKAKQTTKVRVLLIGVILAAVIFAFFGVKWQIGNMLASLTQPSTPGSEDAARLAAGFSPRQRDHTALAAKG